MNFDTGNTLVERKTSGLAIASLVLSIAGIIIPLSALVGMVLGIVALVKIRQNPHCLKGQGLAIAGICVPVVLIVVGVVVLLPALRKARYQAIVIVCESQLQVLGKAIASYQNDNEGACPPNLEMLLASGNITAETLICVACDSEKPIIGTRTELEYMGDIWPLDNQEMMWVYYPSGISYVYRGGDLSRDNYGQMILAYDKIGNHKDGRRNVLCLSGYVQRRDNDELQKEVKMDNARRHRLGLGEKDME